MTDHDPAHARAPRASTSRRSARRSPKRWLLRSPWLILALVLVMTILVWVNWRHQQRAILHADFRLQAAKIHAGLETRIQANEQILRGVGGLFDVNGQVSRDQFRAYVASLRLPEHYPGIRGVGFARRIALADLAAQEAAVRAEGFPEYGVFPSGTRAIYTAIVYLEPFDWRNRRAFGYDMFSESVRREAMLRAWEEDRTALSGKVRLLQETEQDVQAGFLIYLPVYRSGAPHDTPEQRQANLVGWAYSPLRMADLMQSFLQRHFPEFTGRMAVEVYDGSVVSPGARMFASAPEFRPTAESFQQTDLLGVGGHPWALRLFSLPAFDREARRLTREDGVILGAGVALSVSLALLAWILIRTHRRVTEALHQQARAHRALLEAQQRLQLIFDTSDVAIFLTDLQGGITQANARMAEMFRCPLGTLIGSTYVAHIHPDEQETARQRIAELLAEQTAEIKMERRHWRSDGSQFWGQLGGHLIRDVEGQPLGLVGVIADTTQRKEAEAKIDYLAHHDYLTGLPNRALFVERVGQALILAQRTQRHLGLLFLDLNGFKPVNDRYGHQAGDQVLQEVAKRLRAQIRASDTVCRQGGDEFVILVPELPAPGHLAHLAHTLAGVVARPYDVMDVSLSLTVSIGLAVYPEHGSTVEALLQRADAAMYRAKREGPSSVCFAEQDPARAATSDYL